MRRLSFDQNEFEPSESEQALEITISSLREHPDLPTLLAACGASTVDGPAPPAAWTRWPMIAEHLKRFVGIELPFPSGSPKAVLLNDEWNDVELGLVCDSILLWYHWSTSA